MYLPIFRAVSRLWCSSQSTLAAQLLPACANQQQQHTAALRAAWQQQQPLHAAAYSTSSPAHEQQQPCLYVLPMPSLSHAMQSGRISRWLKAPGELVSVYDILAEVTTDNLVEEAYRLDDFAGAVTLLLESQEEAYLAAVLVPDGQEVPIGTPVAILCEDESDVAATADAAQRLKSAGLTNVYDEASMLRQQQQEEARGFSLQLLEWQSYLKESSKDTNSSSSCGCM